MEKIPDYTGDTDVDTLLCLDSGRVTT